MQFENITNRYTMGGAMHDLKNFLGLDPQLPSDTLPLTNWKHKRGDPDAVRRELPTSHNSVQELPPLGSRHAGW